MTSQWQATFFDGSSAAGKAVMLTPGGESLSIKHMDNGEVVLWPYTDVHILYMSKNGLQIDLGLKGEPSVRLKITGSETVEMMKTVVQMPTKKSEWEQGAKVSAVLVAITLVLFLMIWQFERILPDLLPDSYVKSMGKAGADTIHSMYGQTCKSKDGNAALEKMLNRTMGKTALHTDIKLTVANSGMVNALALPDGYIIIFRGLIDKAGNAEEVAGVLAHEIGHVKHKHSLRGLARSLGLDIVLAMMGSGTSVDISGYLMNTSFSRSMESAADEASLKLLEEAGISAQPLSAFFSRLSTLGEPADSDEEDPPSDQGDEKNWALDQLEDLLNSAEEYLSTHPLPGDRAEMFAQAEWETGEAVLNADEWQALRNICGTPETDDSITD